MLHFENETSEINPSARVATLSTDNTMVTRMGGDEFSILLINCANAMEDVAYVIARLEALLSRSLTVNQNSFDISAAIGVSVNDRGGFYASEMLRCADVASEV